MNTMSSRRSELLREIADVAEHVASQVGGLDHSTAEQLGSAVADAIAEHWAGQNIYFLFDQAYSLSNRDKEILTKHRKGHTPAQLAAEYRLSEQWIRKLIKRASLRDPNVDQQPLF